MRAAATPRMARSAPAPRPRSSPRSWRALLGPLHDARDLLPLRARPSLGQVGVRPADDQHRQGGAGPRLRLRHAPGDPCAQGPAKTWKCCTSGVPIHVLRPVAAPLREEGAPAEALGVRLDAVPLDAQREAVGVLDPLLKGAPAVALGLRDDGPRRLQPRPHLVCRPVPGPQDHQLHDHGAEDSGSVPVSRARAILTGPPLLRGARSAH